MHSSIMTFAGIVVLASFLFLIFKYLKSIERKKKLKSIFQEFMQTKLISQKSFALHCNCAILLFKINGKPKSWCGLWNELSKFSRFKTILESEEDCAINVHKIIGMEIANNLGVISRRENLYTKSIPEPNWIGIAERLKIGNIVKTKDSSLSSRIFMIFVFCFYNPKST